MDTLASAGVDGSRRARRTVFKPPTPVRRVAEIYRPSVSSELSNAVGGPTDADLGAARNRGSMLYKGIKMNGSHFVHTDRARAASTAG